MKKNIRLIILLILAVLVLAAGLIVVLNLPDPQGGGNTKVSDNADLLLYDKTSLDAEEISVSNSGGDYVLVGYSYKDKVSGQESSESSESSKKESSASESSENKREDAETSSLGIKMYYTMQDYENIELSKNMTDQLSYQCSCLTALKLVDKSGSKYAEYGLDKPVSTVKTVFSDDSEETIYIGREAPDNQGLYCRRGNDKNVYLVQAASVNMFLVKKFQMFDKTISAEYSEMINDEDKNEIVMLSFDGKAYDKAIKIDSGDDLALNSKYKMHSPNHEICAQEFVQKTGESLYGLSGSEVVAANITAEEKKKYGLDDPYLKINVKALDGSTVTLYASKADKDGKCCVMNEEEKLIFRMDKDEISKWYGLEYKDFLANAIVMPNIDYMTGIKIWYDGEDTDITIKNEKKLNDLFEEIVSTTATVNGKRINFINLDNFLKNLAGMTRKSMDINSVDGYEKQASFVFSYQKDKEKLSDELVIYKNGKGEYAVTLNGMVECTVDAEYVNKLLPQIKMIGGDKEIETIVTSDEASSKESEKASSAVNSSEKTE